MNRALDETRVPAVHTWPELFHTPDCAVAAAASRSASSKTMFALLPTELQVHHLQGLRGGGLNLLARLHRAREVNLADSRAVRDECRTGRTVALDDAQDAVRDSCLG